MYMAFLLIEVVEHCCSIPSLQLGETMSQIAKDMDTHTYRQPLGVTAGITPFNFPAMIPLWVCTSSGLLVEDVYLNNGKLNINCRCLYNSK